MTTTRISAAELFSEPHEFSPREEGMFDELTDEEIEKRAVSDPDAQPWTPEMLRRGRENRRSRVRGEAFRDASVGAKLSTAERDLDLPIFEITDGQGRTILLKALACRRVESPPDPTVRVLKLEAIASNETSRGRDGEADISARWPESQTS